MFVRGKYEQVRLWEAHAQTSYWKLRRINLKTKKEELMLVQGALRNSVLGAYEFIFPKEALAEVCAFFGICTNPNREWCFGKVGFYARNLTLRKIFGCKKIPTEILKKAKELPPSFYTAEFERGSSCCVIPGVAIHPIGIREDMIGELHGYYYELL